MEYVNSSKDLFQAIPDYIFLFFRIKNMLVYQLNDVF